MKKQLITNHHDDLTLSTECQAFLLSAGASVVGFADMTGISCGTTCSLPRAISIGIAYDPNIVRQKKANPKSFHDHQIDIKKRMREVLNQCEEYLVQKGYSTWAPEISKTLPGFTNEFSHKIAARSSGLGWIGKHTLLVTKEFGSWLRLATVFTDAPLKTCSEIKKNLCGGCTKCVEACPCGAIKGDTWSEDVQRDLLLDAACCKNNQKIQEEATGFEDFCWLCLMACPLFEKEVLTAIHPRQIE